MKTRKIRHQFYLDEDLTEKLVAAAAKGRTTKTDIFVEALAAWFASKRAHELDNLLGPRFEGLSRLMGTTGREVQVMRREVESLLELTGVFIQHQLTLVAHHPSFDEEAQLIGSRRYQQVLELVERRLARGGTVSRLAGPAPDPEHAGPDGAGYSAQAQ